MVKAQEFYVDIDLKGNKITNAKLVVLDSAPTADTAKPFAIYNGKLYYNNGTTVSEVADASVVSAIRTELGNKPADATSTIYTRLKAVEDTVGNDSGGNSLATRVTNLETKVDDTDSGLAKTKEIADGAAAAAATAQSAAEAAQGTATTANTTANANKVEIASIKEKDTAQDGRLDALETTVGKAAAGEVAATGLVKGVADNKSAIAALTETVGTNKSDLETAIGKKVDKVEGKGLSTNDYTAEEKTKLAGIATGAQVNVIETVKVNNSVLTPDGKAVNIDLSGYAKKTDISSAYKAMGSTTFADLPKNLTEANKGEIYNVTDPFVDGGKTYPAGTNVLWTGTGWDPLAGYTDFSVFALKTDVTTELAKKQNNLSTEQLAAADSGITAAKVGTYDGYSALITAAQNAADAAQTAADGKVVKNADIAAGTACKITYDKKGLVTKGEALAAADIPTIPVSKVTGVLPVDQTPIMAVTKDVSAATAGTAVAITSGMTTALIAQVFDGDGNVVFCQTAITGGTVSLTFSEAFTGKVHIVGLR